MIRDDPRLRSCESTFFGDLRVWIADHLTVGLQGDVEGTHEMSARQIVTEALADYPAFLKGCNDPAHFGEREAFAAAWQRVVDASADGRAWARGRLLLDDAVSLTRNDLDGGIDAMESFVRWLERGISGAAPATLVPTEQMDWSDIFSLAWKPRDEPDMPDFQAMIAPSTSTREVVIFPWLELSEPVTALGVTILPRAAAIAAVGEADEDALRERTNYFYDVYRKVLTPSVALHVDADRTRSKALVDRAVYALHFAAAAQNKPSGFEYANATLLEYFLQSLGGQPEFVARRVRRRYGSRIDGSATSYLRAQRPAWCGDRLRPHPELIAAFEAVATDADSENIFDALRWYYVGSTDADPIPPDIDIVHIRTAIEILLQWPDDKKSPTRSEQRARIGGLLERFSTWRSTTFEGVALNFHQAAAYVIIEVRNTSLHHKKADREDFPFEKFDVPINWIFDRLFVSLVVATLIAKGVLEDSPLWRGLIESFELWLAGAPGPLNDIWSTRKLTLRGRAIDRDPREPLEVDVALLSGAFIYERPKAP